MDQDIEVNPGLSRQQKTGFVLLLIFAVLAVGLGVLQIRNTIYGPFLVKNNAGNEGAALVLDDKTRLQQIDTDQDGLNDYEEREFYETSPYLPDSDSDGTGDKEEIQNGENPLCPSGTVCDAPEAIGAGTPAPGQSLLPADTVNPLDGVGDSLSGASTGTLPSAGSSEPVTIDDLGALIVNPAALRAILLQSGKITKQQLDMIDDATLLQFAKELSAENGGAAVSRNATSSATSTR